MIYNIAPDTLKTATFFNTSVQINALSALKTRAVKMFF